MLLPISHLLEGRAKPLCIAQSARVQEALRIISSSHSGNSDDKSAGVW